MTEAFYADSGSVAVEVALKMALQYQIAQGNPHKRHFASTKNGYHGDTWHAMSVCDPSNSMHHLYGAQLPVQWFVNALPMGFDTPVDDEVIAKLTDFFYTHHAQLAGFIIEPIVQGAGGMRFYNPAYLRIIQQLCHQYDILFIADEIAIGFGRTGQLFACNHSGIYPDIMTLGKALTGGYLSFAAVLCHQNVHRTIYNSQHNTLMHGPTFMANPLACAVAKSSIELVLDHHLPQKACHIEQQLKIHLMPLLDTHTAVIIDIRCFGAIGVIEVKQSICMDIFTKLCVAHNIWVRPFGKLVYIMPELIISDDELKKLCNQLILTIQDYFQAAKQTQE